MITKICSECGEEKTQDKWHGRRCKQCILNYRRKWAEQSKEYLRQYYQQPRLKKIASDRATQWNKANPEKRRKNALSYYYRLQDEAILAYGGYKCACCGETERLFLTIDHINNDGGEFRKSHNFLHHGARFYKWLKDNNYPSGYQVLCSNCNHGKHRNHGICPHQKA